VVRLLPLLALAVLVTAGCGVRNSKPFTAKGTAPCLKDKGFANVTTDPDQIGFVAAFAQNGGLKATGKSGNVVTIAFTASADDVGDTQASFKRFAPQRYRLHMEDIMQTDRNAVMVWTVTPDPQELDTAKRCLRP
jgi:hypothetical protein